MTRGQHDSTSFQQGESLFWDIADELLEEPGVTRSTMMGYPCLRHNGAFFACVERTTGYLIVKLPADRVQEVVSSGQAASFTPNGRTFREWAAFHQPNRSEWKAMLNESQRFVSG